QVTGVGSIDAGIEQEVGVSDVGSGDGVRDGEREGKSGAAAAIGVQRADGWLSRQDRGGEKREEEGCGGSHYFPRVTVNGCWAPPGGNRKKRYCAPASRRNPPK